MSIHVGDYTTVLAVAPGTKSCLGMGEGPDGRSHPQRCPVVAPARSIQRKVRAGCETEKRLVSPESRYDVLGRFEVVIPAAKRNAGDRDSAGEVHHETRLMPVTAGPDAQGWGPIVKIVMVAEPGP